MEFKIEKKVLSKIEKVYSIATYYTDNPDGSPTILAASETEGCMQLFCPPKYEPITIAKEPGGFISISPFIFEEKPFCFVASNFKPGFNAANCELFIYPLDQGEMPAPISQFSLSYTHRTGFFEMGGEPYIIASRLCTQKVDKDDWAHPGTLEIAPLKAAMNGDWKFTPIKENLLRNHGLELTQIRNSQGEGFLVSSASGLLFAELPDQVTTDWNFETISDQEHSDAWAYDLNENGTADIFSISPFHGNQLSMYRKKGEGWQEHPIDSDLEFGHIVWAGNFLGEKMIFAGSRRGPRELRLYSTEGFPESSIEYQVIEKDIGVAQMKVHQVDENEIHLIVSAHAKDLVILYKITK